MEQARQAFADFHGSALPMKDRASPTNLRLLAANAPPERCPQLWMQSGPDDYEYGTRGARTRQTVAHYAALNSAAALKTLAGLLPQAQWQELAAARDEDGWTVAHCAAQNRTEPAAALQTLAGLLPQAQWQELAAARDNSGRTVAHCAAQNDTEPVAALQTLQFQC